MLSAGCLNGLPSEQPEGDRYDGRCKSDGWPEGRAILELINDPWYAHVGVGMLNTFFAFFARFVLIVVCAASVPCTFRPGTGYSSGVCHVSHVLAFASTRKRIIAIHSGVT